MKTYQGFTREYLGEMFEYDTRLGLLIRRKTTAPNAKANHAAATLDGKGYYHVSIGGKLLRAHRIIFFLVHGELPDEIDHIDGCKTNNFIENLRGATRQQNAGNALCASNTSGFKGVSRNSRTGLWHAQIKIGGKQTYLGRFAKAEDAARRYNTAAAAHFGEFARLNNV
jgi:hypothetical protein